MATLKGRPATLNFPDYTPRTAQYFASDWYVEGIISPKFDGSRYHLASILYRKRDADFS